MKNTHRDLILRWYATHGADDGALTFSNFYLYGGLFDTLASLANLISPFGPVIARTERMGIPLSYARDVRVVQSEEGE